MYKSLLSSYILSTKFDIFMWVFLSRLIVFILRVKGLNSYYLWIPDILVRMRIRILIRRFVPLTYGSGFGSCYFRPRLSIRQQKTIFNTFFCYYFLKVHYHQFLRLNVIKKSQNSRNQGFSYYFCLIIEGSGSGSPTLLRKLA
jgi:hypothetical protein